MFEIIIKILNKFELGKIRKWLEDLCLDETKLLKYTNFICYFLYFLEERIKKLPNKIVCFIKSDDFKKLIKNIVDLLSKNSIKINLFNKKHEIIIFNFYNKHSPNDIDKNYKDQASDMNNIAQLLIQELGAMTFLGIIPYTSLDDFFADRFPKVKSFQGKAPELAEYINDGKYKNLQPDEIETLQKISKAFKIREALKSAENTANWNNFY